jgi:MFS family permease
MENQKAGIAQASVIIATSLLPMMAIVALMPVIPAIVQNFKGMSNIMTWAPMVVSAPGLCVALFSPYAGYLTDKLGRRKLLLIFTILYGLGGILPFFFQSFPALMGGRLILGIGEAFILTIGNTLLGDYFDESERSKWLMWQGIIGSGCGTLLLSLSGYLSTLGWYYPFLVYSFAFFITGAAYLFIFEPKRKTAQIEGISSFSASSTSKFPLNAMLKIALTTLIAATLYFVYTLHFSLALDSIGIKDRQQIGNYSAIASIAVPIGALLFKLVSKKSAEFQFACLFGLIGLGLIGIGSAISVEAVVASAWIQQLGGGMAIPVLIAYGLKNVPAEFRGRGMGFWTSGFFLGQFISPLVVSAVRNMTGSLLSAFIVFGIVCLLLAAYNLFLNKKENLTTPQL